MSAPMFDEPVPVLTAEQIAAYEKDARLLRAQMVASIAKYIYTFVANGLRSAFGKLAEAPKAVSKDGGATDHDATHGTMGATHA
jgi:hypothetical protein